MTSKKSNLFADNNVLDVIKLCSSFNADYLFMLMVNKISFINQQRDYERQKASLE